MKSKLLHSVILVVGFVLVDFSVNQGYSQTPQSKPVEQHNVKYICIMHPEVVKDNPGKCTKCGMPLVEKKEMKQGEMRNMHDRAMLKHHQMMNDSIHMSMGMMKDSLQKKKAMMMDARSKQQGQIKMKHQ